MKFDELAWERFKNRVRDGAYSDEGISAFRPAAMRVIGLDTVPEGGKLFDVAWRATMGGSLFNAAQELEQLVRLMPEPIRVQITPPAAGPDPWARKEREKRTPEDEGGSFVAKLCRLVEEQSRAIVYALETVGKGWAYERIERISDLGDKITALIKYEFGGATYDSLSGRADIERTKAEAAEPAPGTVEYAAQCPQEECPDPWRQNEADDCVFQPAPLIRLINFAERAAHRAEQARIHIQLREPTAAVQWAMALRDDARETLKIINQKPLPEGVDFESVAEAVNRQLEKIMAEAEKHAPMQTAISAPSPWRMVWHIAKWAKNAIEGNYDPIAGPWPPKPAPVDVPAELTRIAGKIYTADHIYSHGAYDMAREKFKELEAEVRALIEKLQRKG